MCSASLQRRERPDAPTRGACDGSGASTKTSRKLCSVGLTDLVLMWATQMRARQRKPRGKKSLDTQNANPTDAFVQFQSIQNIKCSDFAGLRLLIIQI